MNHSPDLRGWLPVSISKHTAEPIVEWCRFGTRRFTEAFFDHTVQNAMREPFNLLFRRRTGTGRGSSGLPTSRKHRERPLPLH